MRDRQVLEALLTRRFPGATPDQVAAAANAIMALIQTWDSTPRPILRMPEQPMPMEPAPR